jgi:hypothetical protein
MMTAVRPAKIGRPSLLTWVLQGHFSHLFCVTRPTASSRRPQRQEPEERSAVGTEAASLSTFPTSKLPSRSHESPATIIADPAWRSRCVASGCPGWAGSTKVARATHRLLFKLDQPTGRRCGAGNAEYRRRGGRARSATRAQVFRVSMARPCVSRVKSCAGGATGAPVAQSLLHLGDR